VHQPERDLDRDLQTLHASKTAWARLVIDRKIALLHAVKDRLHDVAEQWVDRAIRAKGLAPHSPLAGEEWISGPWAVLYALTRYIRTLESIARTGSVKLPAMHRRPDGRVVLAAFPRDLYDRFVLSGVHAEIWMQRGVSPDDAREDAGKLYRENAPSGRVELVLGAGNIASIASLDLLYKMIHDGAVCMVKLNPINDYVGALLELAFAPLIEGGFLRFAYGGADVGAYLCAHPYVETIHITGSEETYQRVARGPGRGKTITSELGNVSPTIVVPGEWHHADLQFQAEHIATQKAHNAGFNCVAAQVLVLPKAWAQGAELRARIHEVFARMERRDEYYPGAKDRRAALAGRDSARLTLLPADASDINNPIFSSEAFCGVLGYVELNGSIDDYVPRAVSFANERLHGTLGANIIVHPATRKRHAGLVDRAIADLRYGCIGVNAWTGVGYFLTETPWGAYRGHALDDVGSGIGVVHNSFLLEQTEKSVVHAPFAPFPRNVRDGELSVLPKPPWFITNSMAAQIGRALCDFEVARTPANALRVASLALRG
jgi:aldehyde dehydrogenase (NAD(P)+)